MQTPWSEMEGFTQWDGLTPTEQFRARASDLRLCFVAEDEVLFMRWNKVAGVTLLAENSETKIQIINDPERKLYWLLRLGSGRVITNISYNDLMREDETMWHLSKSSNERHQRWLERLHDWEKYWNRFDREQTALLQAKHHGVGPELLRRVQREARNINGWFTGYNAAADQFNFARKRDSGGSETYHYTSIALIQRNDLDDPGDDPECLDIPRSTIASESDYRLGADNATREAVSGLR